MWPSEGLEILHCISGKSPQLGSISLQWLQKLWERKDHGLRWWVPVYGIWRRQNEANRQILSKDIRQSSISWYVCLFVLLDMCRFAIKLPWQVTLAPVMLNDSLMTGSVMNLWLDDKLLTRYLLRTIYHDDIFLDLPQIAVECFCWGHYIARYRRKTLKYISKPIGRSKWETWRFPFIIL